MRSSTRKYQSPPEIAEILGVSVKKVLHWIETEELPAVNVATNRGARPRWKISPQALAQFEIARRSLPTQPQEVRRPKKRDSTHVIQFV